MNLLCLIVVAFLFCDFAVVHSALGGLFGRNNQDDYYESEFDETNANAAEKHDNDMRDLCNGPPLFGIEWVLHHRQPDYGWGEDTHRAIVILELNNYGGALTTHDINLMRHQLEVQLTGTMLRHGGSIPSPTDLALYVQALLAIGRNPRDFHGLDLVKDLLRAVNSDKKPHPFLVLVLCSARAAEDDHLYKLHNHLFNIHSKTGQDRELAAIAFKAFACARLDKKLNRLNNLAKDMDEAAKALAASQNEDGSFGNLYTTALIFQALKVYGYEKTWNEQDALQFLDRSQKSLANNMLMNYCIELARHSEKGLFFSLEAAPLFGQDGYRTIDYLKSMDKKYFVHYTVKVGEDPQMYHTVAIKVPEKITFFDVMRLVAEDDLKFNFSYTLVQNGQQQAKKPVVYRISSIPNDAENGLYWRLVHETDINHDRHVSKMVELETCLDGSEACEFGHLPCDDGQCIMRAVWCNGPSDCSDGSDEMYCRKRSPFDKEININGCQKSLHFRCETGECIPKAARCDDMPDCSSGEDEENCDYYFEYGFDPTPEETTPKETPTTPSLRWESSSSTITEASSVAATTPHQQNQEKTVTDDDDDDQQGRGDVRLPLLSSLPSSADSLKIGIRHILDERDEQWGWGRSTAKMAVALYLANHTYFDPDNFEGQLSAKQLEVRLAVDLMKNDESPLRLPELAHYVHALLVTCHNPRNFYGVNLLKLLRKEMSYRRSKKLFVAPIVYLALCNAGDSSSPDAQVIRRMKNMAYRRSQEQRWLDTQAYALLTISCYSQRNNTSPEWKHLKQDVSKNLTEWQLGDGSFGSVYSTALALQALIAAQEQGTESAKGRAMTYLKLKQKWDGTFGSEVDNFYTLPALNLNSMASIGKRHCKFMPSSTLSTEASNKGKKGKKKTKKLHVHYSLWIGGGDKNEMHTITLTLPPHSNFLDVMEAAAKANPKYKHDVWMGNRGPVVQSIAGRSIDIERSLYWTLYRKVPLPFRPQIHNATATTARLKLLGATKYIKDIRKLHPKDGEHLAFWLKPYY